MINISKFTNVFGIVSVQIEGFFTERFINLCKMNNVAIYDVRNITKGVVRFKMNISEFKKLRKIAKKTKCKVKIKDKKGLYFKLFKYRKRKMVVLLFSLAIFFCLFTSSFIWRVEVVGNENVPTEDIITSLKESGIYKGKLKFSIDKKEVINSLRIKQNEIMWAGINIDGSKAIVTVVEKTRINKESVQNAEIGNIVAVKSGVISKIVPENGTAIFKEGSYITKGDIAIEGAIYNKYVDNKKVTAKGILQAKCEYVIDGEYEYSYINKIYTGKTKYRFAITTNIDKSIENSLNKSKKYDITKESKKVNIFGKDIFFNTYKCVEYIPEELYYTYEELCQIANDDIEEKINKNMEENCKSPEIVSKDTQIEKMENKIVCHTVYVLNEDIAEFVSESYDAPYLLNRKSEEK